MNRLTLRGPEKRSKLLISPTDAFASSIASATWKELSHGQIIYSNTRSNMIMQRFAEALGFVRAGEIEGIEEDELELIYVKRLRHQGKIPLALR